MPVDKSGLAFHQSDVGRREQGLYAATQLGHHFRLALAHMLEVDGGLRIGRKARAEHVGFVTPGLGRYATHVETGAPYVSPFDDDHIEAMLCGMPGGLIAAGSATYYNKVSCRHAAFVDK